MRIRFKHMSRYAGVVYQPGATETVTIPYAARVVGAGLAEYAPEPWEAEEYAAVLGTSKPAASKAPQVSPAEKAAVAADKKRLEAEKKAAAARIAADAAKDARKKAAWEKRKAAADEKAAKKAAKK